ncbi:MAG: hypothetical protein HOP08_16480 [Cyclobacteriaceae bacterium]|nr:hypothetical protein [Cyclobacteriaceae bacterium]
MNSAKENLTPQESLAVITSMIAQAKGNAEKNSFHFLLWGWTILIANLGVYALLRFTTVENPYLFWAITIPASVVSAIVGARQEKASLTSTHLDTINKWIWISYGIAVFTLVAFGKSINFQINPVVITLTAVPTFVTGVILRFTPLKLGGLAFWILGMITFLVPKEYQYLIAALAIALGYLVPGYMLKARKG